MPKQKPLIIFKKCNPDKCSPESGICASSLVCPKSILIQEDAFDPPMLVSCSMCTGCGDCAKDCPLTAIIME
ncbi:hypothetical protein ACFL2X_05570 [Candidatus Latescibacterota bacterium]